MTKQTMKIWVIVATTVALSSGALWLWLKTPWRKKTGLMSSSQSDSLSQGLESAAAGNSGSGPTGSGTSGAESDWRQEVSIPVITSSVMTLNGEASGSVAGGSGVRIETVTMKKEHFALRYGSNNDSVKVLQALYNQLVSLGVVEQQPGWISVDGIWGPKTERAASQIYGANAVIEYTDDATGETKTWTLKDVVDLDSQAGRGNYCVKDVEGLRNLARFISKATPV